MATTGHDTDTDLADRIAMWLGGGLILLGVVGLGLVETLTGPPFAPVTGEGAVATGATVGPDLRAGLVVAGMVVWGLYAVYRVVCPALGLTEAPTSERTSA